MKQKDIILITVVVFISIVFSLVISKYLIATPQNRQQKAEVVQSISSSFKPADDRFFNDKAYDPTRQISIEENANSNPFNSTGQ